MNASNCFRTPDNDSNNLDTPLRDIFIVGARLAENLDEIEAALIEQQAGIFQRHGTLVSSGATSLRCAKARRSRVSGWAKSRRPG